MARGPSDPTIDLHRILRQKNKPAKSKARWRIMVASDPGRPVRTFTLPRLLPTLLSLSALVLVDRDRRARVRIVEAVRIAGRAPASRSRDGAGR